MDNEILASLEELHAAAQREWRNRIDDFTAKTPTEVTAEAEKMLAVVEVFRDGMAHVTNTEFGAVTNEVVRKSWETLTLMKIWIEKGCGPGAPCAVPREIIDADGDEEL